jgi:hypothetical protein
VFNYARLNVLLTGNCVNVEFHSIFPLTPNTRSIIIDCGGDEMNDLQNLLGKMTGAELVTVLRVVQALTEEMKGPIPADRPAAD